jgi:glycosyltransferase involved in cell wall biosynthesis
VFNAARTIARCIDSIAAQTYLSHELIIIDGGSTDGTIEILQQKSSQISYWVSEPDSGVYSAWNKGLKHASGEWIGFLGADDYLWTNDALEYLVQQCDKVFPRIRIVYGCVGFVSERGEVLEVFGRPWEEIRDLFRSRMVIPHPAVLCHRSLFEQHGLFDESFRISGDYEWLLRELKEGDALFVSGPMVVGMQAGGMSSRASLAFKVLREGELAQSRHGLKPGFFARSWAYSKAYVRVGVSSLLGEQLGEGVVNRLRQARAMARKLGSYIGT